MRRILSGIVLLLTLGALGCSTGDTMFSSTGSLKPQLLDLTLSTQTSTEPSNQFMKWTVTKAEADVPGVGTVSFLTQPQCEQVQQIFSLNAPAAATCRFQITGLALDAGSSGTATVRLEVKDVWVTRATRPVLVPDGDYDGDGVLDADDNCIYIENPEQENENEADETEKVGDACTNANGAKDSDADGIADSRDNCVYEVNPDQELTSSTDGFVDTVGDACRERIEVTLPGPTLVIRRTDQAYTIRDSGTTLLRFDFRSMDWCPNEPDHTTCVLTADDVTLTVQ